MRQSFRLAASAIAALAVTSTAAATAATPASAVGPDKPQITEKTETTTTSTLPGIGTQVEYASAPIRFQRDGQWIDIDTRLVERDGALHPRAVEKAIAFSAGGNGDLITVSDGKGGTIDLNIDATLPKPRIEGSQATYPGAAPGGGDLVVTATRQGVSYAATYTDKPASSTQFKLNLAEGKAVESGTGAVSVTTSGGLKAQILDVPARRLPKGTYRDQADNSPEVTVKAATEATPAGEGTDLVVKPDTRALAAAAEDPNRPPGWEKFIEFDRGVEDAYVGPDAPKGVLDDGLMVGGGYTSYVRFPAAGDLEGNADKIMDARVDLSMRMYLKKPADINEALPITVNRVTGAWQPATLTKAKPPTATNAEEAPAYGWPTWDGGNTEVISVPVADIARAWAKGNANQGVALKGGPDYFMFGSSRVDTMFTKVPTLTVIFGKAPRDSEPENAIGDFSDDGDKNEPGPEPADAQAPKALAAASRTWSHRCTRNGRTYTGSGTISETSTRVYVKGKFTASGGDRPGGVVYFYKSSGSIHRREVVKTSSFSYNSAKKWTKKITISPAKTVFGGVTNGCPSKQIY